MPPSTIRGLVFRRRPHLDDPVRLAERQRPQQDAVDDAGGGGVRADAYGEGEDGDGGEAGGLGNVRRRTGVGETYVVVSR